MQLGGVGWVPPRSHASDLRRSPWTHTLWRFLQILKNEAFLNKAPTLSFTDGAWKIKGLSAFGWLALNVPRSLKWHFQQAGSLVPLPACAPGAGGHLESLLHGTDSTVTQLPLKHFIASFHIFTFLLSGAVHTAKQEYQREESPWVALRCPATSLLLLPLTPTFKFCRVHSFHQGVVLSWWSCPYPPKTKQQKAPAVALALTALSKSETPVLPEQLNPCWKENHRAPAQFAAAARGAWLFLEGSVPHPDALQCPSLASTFKQQRDRVNLSRKALLLKIPKSVSDNKTKSDKKKIKKRRRKLQR